jgi:hypothetical protein
MGSGVAHEETTHEQAGIKRIVSCQLDRSITLRTGAPPDAKVVIDARQLPAAGSLDPGAESSIYGSPSQAPEQLSAIVGTPARKHAHDGDDADRLVALEEDAPIANAQPPRGLPSELEHV